MVERSLLGRIAKLARANLTTAVDEADDPRAAVDSLLDEYGAGLAEVESALADALGDLRLLEEDLTEHRDATAAWRRKAEAALARADDLRARGDAGEAGRFDRLARVAVGHEIDAERLAGDLGAQVDRQAGVVNELKDALQSMRAKRDELRRRRDELVARSSSVDAQQRLRSAGDRVDVLDPGGALRRFEDEVERAEARLEGHRELDDPTERFAELSERREVEERLARLRARREG